MTGVIRKGFLVNIILLLFSANYEIRLNYPLI